MYIGYITTPYMDPHAFLARENVKVVRKQCQSVNKG